ncbi:hypothetical protein HDA32_002777 [Spinactinospora alkalitolerans]|uniref:ATP-dependent helicase n=1 Tax=Spinactinospora alkalitolerans TaxID=687207 RepID=A0A852TWG3_9ACTN|nr:DEAD/DEAH box helicase [Spinactinospora alkalitolerans]NYE47657.1 hypothetical protein [Spinactinospora alkalitolerans]
MLVLHGAWAEEGLTLWAEDSGAPARTASRAAVRPHPYAAAADALRETVAGLVEALDTAPAAPLPGSPADVAKADAVGLELRLPGSAGHPLPSPGLEPLADAPAVRSAAPRPWRVPACLFPPATAAALLPALRDAATGDVAQGPGLRHLIAVQEFADLLVGAGRLLPLLIDDPPSARWRPVLTGAEARHFRALTTALPPVARAHLPSPAPRADGLVFTALSALVDAAARARFGTRNRRGGPHWTRALTGEDARLDAPGGREAAAGDLADRLRAWYDAAHRQGERARLVFRLAEPDRDAEPAADTGAADADGRRQREQRAGERRGETWRVEFWVRSGTDPSLQLPLRDLWLGEGAAWLPDDVETAMLGDLGRAARHYPALGAALRELAPAEVTMGTGGAHAFIKDVAPRLDAAGFAIVLPHWAGRRALGLRLTTREQPPATGGGIGADELVDFSFDAVLGEEALDIEELAELARLKQPLVRLRGRWVEADPAHLRTALEFLRRRGRGTMRRGEAVRTVLSPEEPTTLPITGVDADGALGALLGGSTEQRIAPMPTPEGFTGALRPYQERGAAWLRFLGGLGLGAVLADDMGLGKTVQLLALLTGERARPHPGGRGSSPGPTLLICPVSLVGNWQREAARFAPSLRLHVHHGPDRPHGNGLARLLAGTDLVITTYGVVLRDAEELTAMPWHRVVCDEAQAIKNSGTRQARAVRGLPADTRIALTGTPVENNLGELWSIMEFANPGLLGSEAGFRRHAGRIERAHAAEGGEDTASGGADGGDGGAALLKRLTGPFILRRLKTDRSIISDLPEKLEMRTWCTLTPEQASLYKAAVDEMTERIDGAEGIQRKGLVLATMARLKQICNHPAQFLGDGSALAGRSGKLERLERLLAEATAEGDKALCFTQYTAFGDRLAPYLAARLGRPVLWLHGGTPRHRREEMTARFQDSAEPMVFLLSLKAAGTGLNLTAANHVVHIDRWWNPAVEDQATDRAFRIGQRRDVQVRKLICVGTLEERVDEMIERKKALAQSVVGTGEDWLTGLSTARLREVVRLAPEAVAQ